MSDKELLIELYKSTKGKFWLRKDNWISAEPCRRWFGLTINSSGHVTVINLRRNHLQESLNNVLSWRMLSNIHTVCLSENSLTGRIPPQIGDMKSIEELDLSWNEFIGHLPDKLFTLTNLRVLKLEHNQLEGEISEQLSSLTKLRFLDISMNQFSGQVPKVGHLLPDLQILDLSRNNFEGFVPSLVKEYVAYSLTPEGDTDKIDEKEDIVTDQSLSETDNP